MDGDKEMKLNEAKKGKVGSMSSNYGKKEEEKKNQARSDDLTSDLFTPSDCQRVRAP